jgi:hypothetical protein
MTEKALSEIRFIETDEGYRVEIKGYKEKLKGTQPNRTCPGPSLQMSCTTGHQSASEKAISTASGSSMGMKKLAG